MRELKGPGMKTTISQSESLAVSAGPYQADEKRAEIVLLSEALGVRTKLQRVAFYVKRISAQQNCVSIIQARRFRGSRYPACPSLPQQPVLELAGPFQAGDDQ
jgi:hypothetical protein